MTPAHPRFLTDAMLIRLARWLRALGYDTRDIPDANDAELVALANREARWLLTRDGALLRELRPHSGLYIASQRPLEQLGQVLHHFRLRPVQLAFSRCMLCNRSLQPLGEESVMPDYASHLTDQHRMRCPNCQRIYWYGAHAKRMTRTLQTAGLLPVAGPSDQNS